MQAARKACEDDSWKLAVGDIVYIDEGARPHRVFRIGFAQYEKEVRVARLHEDTTRWSTGFWVGTDRCYKLEPGDSVTAMKEIIDATEARREIPRGTKCIFTGWDPDGDVMLEFEAAPGRRAEMVVFVEELDKLSLE